ncbi:MAG: serine/threonine protein kinase [Bacteroidaceae bacterium]|nr:serine/threonine protein kinase [Bacteroidaceae bacterium]
MNVLDNNTYLLNGKYIIDQYLSSGGFGNTYLAHEATTMQHVAIKELFVKEICTRTDNIKNVTISIHQNKGTFIAHLKKFKKEADRLSSIVHDNVIKVKEWFEENGTAYYVMEYIEGCTLKDIVTQNNGLSETEVSKLLPDLLSSLDCIHTNGLYHMDIKPGNIMLKKDGTPILIDFGASKHIVDESGNTVSTSSSIAMTMGYASPEQMEQNLDKIGSWSDLYSLGATLYNCILLKNPPSPSEIVENGTKAFNFPDEISQKLRNLITWLMNPAIYERPHSAKQVLLWWNSSSIAIPAKENVNDYATVVVGSSKEELSNKKGLKTLLYVTISVVIIGFVAFSFFKGKTGSSIIDTVSVKKDTVDSIDVIPQKDSLCVRYASLQKDNFVIYQDSLDRILYVPRQDANDLYVLDVLNNSKNYIKSSHDIYSVDTILTGRNADEVFLFSIQGSLGVCYMIRYNIKTMKEEQFFDLEETGSVSRAYPILKVPEGFELTYFVNSRWTLTQDDEYWVNIIDYNGNIIKTMKKDYRKEQVMTKEELEEYITETENYSYDSAPKGLFFTDISITDNCTILNVKCVNDGSEWITIDGGTYIVANNIKYYLLNAEGIEISPKKTYLSGANETVYFKLYFQPIPMNTTSINFIEPGDSNWKFYNLNIQR